jgi:septum formation protein
MNYQEIILASASPRRTQLLAALDIPFVVRTKEVDEDFPDTLPAAQVPVFLAEKKAAAWEGALQEGQLLITADTVVILGNHILNKPADAQEAAAMLRSLSGTMHEVVTGLCLTDSQGKSSFSDSTKVYFKQLTEAEIAYYISHYRPYDKAGAYGAQEWLGMVAVERVEGSYFNVMGLPLHLLYRLLAERGLAPREKPGS